jgi:metal-responsive CopG/Arc/MetJ family transcriptional regulator
MAKRRIQIYLDPEVHQDLKERARAEGISLSELIRRVAKDYLRKEAAPKDFLAIVGLGQSGKADISEKHDDYLAQAVSDENIR